MSTYVIINWSQFAAARSQAVRTLTLVKPIVENPTQPKILAWEYTEGSGEINVYVWLKDYDYVAIMKKTKRGGLILKTAYWLEYNHTKEKLAKKYAARNKKANA